MARPGTAERPLRVAVVGSGPAGFYTVQHLFQQKELVVEVDMYDRLPTPFGLVRHGVAPDHQKIKNVIAVYHKLAGDPRFRFFGDVDYGARIDLETLGRHYDQVVFATGAQTDRRLGIPGEDLRGSHPATDFVAWYNGHPDFSDLTFDLSCRQAMVVGVGNVAVDVARILSRSVEELATTDIADYALEALRHSRVRTVYLVGRRGPAQAAFTNPEVKELGELAETATSTRADEVELDPASQRTVDESSDRATLRKIEILQSYAGREDPTKPRKLVLRFLASPTEILGGEDGRVRAVRLVRNRLEADDRGVLRSRPTEQEEVVETGLVFRSVGYRGVPLAGLPFDERWGTVPNDAGRVCDPTRNEARTGLYVSGWIKRGPSGVIGTNKPDAAETVRRMVEDVAAGRLLEPSAPSREALERTLSERGVRYVSYPDWIRLDELEIARGKPLGRPRVKFTRREEFRLALEG